MNLLSEEDRATLRKGGVDPDHAEESLRKVIEEESDQFWKDATGGRKPKGVKYRTVMSLSQAQADSLAELAAVLGPSQRIEFCQTFSESGGTHLYVRSPSKRGHDYHIARNGQITSLG